MPTVVLAPTFGAGYQAFTAGGLPLNQGKIYTYINGGTTPQATYTTSAGNVQNDNPIVLGADGRPPNEIWLVEQSGYRFDLTDANDNLIKTYDNIGVPFNLLATNNLSDVADAATARENLGLGIQKTALSIVAGVVTIDCSVSDFFTLPLTAAVTSFTLTNVPASGTAYGFALEITADGSSRSVTWTMNGTAVSWPSGTAPTLTTTNNKRDLLIFYTYNNATTISGITAAQNL